ncbi:MAG: PAS domain S-box protein, partial [Nitrospiria bacterium]
MQREGSDDSFDDFFDHAATALHCVGPDGRILRANLAELTLLGYSEQEYIGRPIADVHADPEAIADILRRLAAHETLRDYEARLRCKDGSIKHVLINSNVKWDHGRFVHTRCVTTDITARKQMEDELRDREGDFRQMLDQLPVGVCVCDREAILTRYNRRATEIWGRAPVIGDRHERYCGSFRLWRPDGRPLPHEETPVAGVLAGGPAARNVELIVERTDGTRVAVQADIDAIRNRDGEIVGAINCFQDVTDRRQAKAALRDAEALLRTVVTNAPIVVFALDLEGVFTLSEGKGLLAMGLHPGDAVGRSVFDLYRDAPWVVSAVRRALHGDTSTRNGAVGSVWFEMHHTPLRDDQGQVIGVVGVAVDLTDQKRIEEEVSRASKLESIGVLAGGIAHDFNNMLMAIVGNLSLAKLLVDREGKVFQRIDESQKAAMRARTLTQQLLTFSRGGKPVRKQMALEPVIRESAGFALQGSNVRCEIEFADPLWPVEADEGQVGQVIANLVINAQQAMPEGGTIGL